MSQEKLGKILTGNGQRDAVHIAVVPMLADMKMQPGEHVGVNAQGQCSCVSSKRVGIVDPFLQREVKEGEWFFCYLYPNTITGLTHVWSHPAFPDIEKPTKAAPGSDASASKQWLRDYADRLNVGYRDLIEAADYYVQYGEYMVRGGVLEGESTDPLFWTHWEIVTGKSAAGKDEDNFFSCSC